MCASAVEEEGYFEYEGVHEHFNSEVQGVANEELDSDGDEITPFEKISRKMKKVTDDGGVRKVIRQPGNGAVVPSDAFVTGIIVNLAPFNCQIKSSCFEDT